MHIENFTKPPYSLVLTDFLQLLSWRVTIAELFLLENSLGRCRTRAEPMEYQKENDDKFKTEKKIADEIMAKIHELQLPFKLDQPTEGLGNCFPIAIVQQLQRPEIFSQLRPSVQRLAKDRYGHTLLRQNVHAFIMKSRHPRVAEFRQQYEELEGQVSGQSWRQYWTSMVKDRTWVDSWFVQATAWYLQLDIWIITTSNTENSPYIDVNGNMADGNKPSGGPIITIGTKSNVHYQSLLPIEAFHLGFRDNHVQEADQKNSRQATDVTNPENTDSQSGRKVEQSVTDKDFAHEMPQKRKRKDQEIKDKLCKKDMDEKKTSEEQNAQHIEGKDRKANTIYSNSKDKEEQNAKKVKEDPMDIDADGNRYGPFLFDSYGELIVFRRMSDDYIMKCALCGKRN